MRTRFLQKTVIVVAIIMITKPAMNQTVADTAIENKNVSSNQGRAEAGPQLQGKPSLN